jgi:hypothetical protein
VKFQVKEKESYKLMRDYFFPVDFFNFLKKLAKNYGANVRFAEFDNNYSGSYNWRHKLIKIYRYDKESNFMPTEYVFRIFFHELAHHIQRRKRLKFRSVEEYLLFEQEACDIGFELAKKHAPTIPVKKEVYIDGFSSIKDLEMFAQHYKLEHKRSTLDAYKRFEQGTLHPKIYGKESC